MDPPPPPPHGNTSGNRSSGLPPGNYDIFIIPPHSSGSGFLYLPSLQPHRNSFLAGVACTLLTVAIWTVVFPVLREWFATIVASGGMGVVILLVGVGVAGWAWGKTQIETGRPAEGGAGGASGAHKHTNAGATGGPAPGATGGMPGPTGGMPGATGGMPGATGGMPGASGGMPGATPGFTPGFTPGPKPTWQRANTGPGRTTGTNNTGAAKSGWEKAREETRKKEEERRRGEELKKKREEEEKERVKQRERDAREREARERRERVLREKEVKEKEAREKEEKEREAREREAREREAREREAREREAREKEAREKEAREKEARDRTEKEARENEVKQRATANTSRSESPTKNRKAAARTATEDDASASYSFRPYDKQSRKTASASSIYSESSYAPSHSTSRTTPPPSHRGPYHTKDPDKIVLKAVYSFNNAFTKLPIAKLISGVGSVTDGLILRITTEGLFIDDDVRGVPQREWDVKAWTLKLVEVWCPQLHCGASSGSTPAASRNPAPGRYGVFGGPKAAAAAKLPTIEETQLFLDDLLTTCKGSCHASSASKHRPNPGASLQSGEYKGLHVLRASLRDQEGKRYVFVLREEEGWKVAVGLQRLRRGTQVRALGVSGMNANEAKGILENLGWT
ncbi:MAG: hypothetical protein FRX48_08175 [Lasallia pustulata]|uniref:Uncharacterized protein n=1 Tax=Lasallia pustulata TaxID=136370 RepID=A0A5M8PG36_9LECA|nr:MAG: hypothetical protein FRX48_08175 [Lasallia pustulata]